MAWEMPARSRDRFPVRPSRRSGRRGGGSPVTVSCDRAVELGDLPAFPRAACGVRVGAALEGRGGRAPVEEGPLL